MKKSLVMVSVFALVALTGCKKDNSVDNKAIIDALFSAGMSWNGQQKAAADERLKSTYPIYVSVDNYVYGTEGGYIHVTGSVSGSMTIDDYSYTVTGGSMFLGLTESIVEYTFESEGNVYTMNGAPYISLTGTFTLMPGGTTFGTASSMQIGGAVQITGPRVNQTVDIDITININSSGTGGDVSGTVDGVPLNYSF